MSIEPDGLNGSYGFWGLRSTARFTVNGPRARRSLLNYDDLISRGNRVENEALMIDISGRIPAQPPGWVYDGIRKINNYEYHFDGVDWVLWLGSEQSTGIYPAAVKAKTWRPATEADVGRTDARFFDHKEHPYCVGKLLHVGSGNFVAISNGKYGELFKRDHASNWKYCEVPVEDGK